MLPRLRVERVVAAGAGFGAGCPLDPVVDRDRGFGLRALDEAVVSGRDVRVLGARNREGEASARVARALRNEREAKKDICDMRVKRGAEAREGIWIVLGSGSDAAPSVLRSSSSGSTRPTARGRGW